MISVKTLKPPAKIGIVGGGQLGRMLSQEAKRMGYHVTVLDPTPNSPAAQVCDKQIIADFTDSEAIKKLAEETDVLTYEFEHINADALCNLKDDGISIIPSGDVLKKIQNKYLQKCILKDAGLPVPDFWKVNSVEDIEKIAEIKGLPLILKSCFGGYDGKGNAVIRTKNDIKKAVEALKNKDYYLEEFIPFTKELSIITAIDSNKKSVYYPVAENIHEENILRLTKVPAIIEEETNKKVFETAKKVMEVLDESGVFCIELFLDASNNIYINEIAPRPHNSGHYSIEACVTSQYEQLVRILTGLPLGATKLLSPCVMVNILGNNESVESLYYLEGVEHALSIENVYIHMYGKEQTSKLRKLGHITILSESVEMAEDIADKVLKHIKVVSTN